MNAPDKIYLHPDIGGREFIRPWLRRAANSESVAYIRRDALLEVIATAREAAVIQKNFNNCPSEQEVRIDVYDYIVNEIESL